MRLDLFCPLLLCALAVSTGALADPQAPEDAIRAFYSWVLAHPSRALPSPKERGELTKTMSPELLGLLKEASATEAKCVRAAPRREKPLIVEGDLFVGNYEGANEIAYGEVHRNGNTAGLA